MRRLPDSWLIQPASLEPIGGSTAPRVAVPVANVEPRRGPWSGSAELGQRQNFFPAQLRRTLLKMQEWGMPAVWTVSLSLDYPKPTIGNSFVSVTGEVIFGVGGATQRALVDFANGVQFSLAANSIEVNATAVVVGVNVADVDIRAQLARGTIGQSNAFRTLGVTGVAAGATSALVEVPVFAKAIQVSPIDKVSDNALFGSSDCWIRFFSDPTALTRTGLYRTDRLASGAFPIPGGSRYFALENGSAGIVGLRAIFQLSM